ncbi:hypothetical protein [Flavobacterium sp. DG2-3]|uniref:hypothetical protein n=1 Tax=Flavobacterium sp. DG2-3 TaxID=3068317 RepID=UPI00273DAA13|nr:hypothetical protein [Flavobacterium sp. DG2-3]MDP5201343.1 hypothetical protein [Flavobacterium sp. DG2-3]
MKKTAILLTTICASALLYVSCSSDNNEPTVTTDLTTIGASVAVDTSNEMDLNTSLLISTATSTTGKTTETAPLPGICATITITTPNGGEYPKVFLADFGTAGCKDANNLTRKGQLKVTLSGAITATGSKMTIERINYSINGIKLEGTIEYTNTTTTPTVPQWTRKVTNGKLTDLQGGVYTNSGTYTTKQTAGVDTPFILSDNVYEITEGTHTVTATAGGTLTLTVKEPLIKKYSCLFISKGQLKVQGGILNGVIDYGNNDCDALYTYTHENGTSFNLTM